MGIALPPGVQSDHSIVDLNGNVISSDEREKIIADIMALPASQKVDDIMYALRGSPIMLVRGETGSGKSLQIPKAAYQYTLNNKASAPRVIANQPRVSAAVGLARRASYELLCETGDPFFTLGEGVGYRTGRGKLASDHSAIAYHTSGYELMRFSASGSYPDVMVLDEFHTDDISNTMLAYLVRKYLLEVKSKFKLIITSATINTIKTLDYFRSVTSDMPIIDIEGRPFGVEIIQAKSGDLMKYVQERHDKGENMIIFVAGKGEVEDVIQRIQNTIGKEVILFPFHSDLSIEEQRHIINYIPKEGEHVIVVATNAAEESLTVSFLHTVIDTGNHKVASTDKNGVKRLDLEPVSKANFRQRVGRAGRVRKGLGIRVNDTPFESLDDFPIAPITHMTLEKEILILLSQGINVAEELTKHYTEGVQMFIDNPSDDLVNLSYERLYRLGAIDTNGITELGQKILHFPLGVFNSRILIEAIERGVVKDMLEIVAILEHNGFLIGSGEWQDIYEKAKTKYKRSDMFFQLHMFRDLTSKELGEKQLNFFSSKCNFGFQWRKEYEKGEKRLFELVDDEVLQEFGVNKRSLQKMVETVEELQLRFVSEGIKLSDTGNTDDKIVSLLTGNLHHIFEYQEREEGFRNAFLNWGNIIFSQGNTSIVELGNEKKGASYIGIPFIIGGNNEREDFNLLHSITFVDEKHLSEVMPQITTGVPNFNFRGQTNLSRARKAYKVLFGETLPLTKRVSVKQMQDKILGGFIAYLEENSAEYSSMIILYKQLKGDMEARRALKGKFKTLILLQDTYLQLIKRKGWGETFIEDLEDILAGDYVTLGAISLGVATHAQLLMSDPTIRQHNFLEIMSEQKALYADIRKVFSDIELTSKQRMIFRRSFTKLHSVNGKKFNVGKEHVAEFIARIEKKIQQNDEIIAALKATGKKKRTDTKIDSFFKENRRYTRIIKNIIKFRENAEQMRKRINSIDFREVLYSERDSEKIIFTKKYLFSIIGNVIFNGDFMSADVKTEEKLKERIQKYLGLCMREVESIDLVNAIKNATGKDINSKTRGNANLTIQKYLKRIKPYFNSEITEETDNVLARINKLHEGQVAEVYGYIKEILLEFFDTKETRNYLVIISIFGGNSKICVSYLSISQLGEIFCCF